MCNLQGKTIHNRIWDVISLGLYLLRRPGSVNYRDKQYIAGVWVPLHLFNLHLLTDSRSGSLFVVFVHGPGCLNRIQMRPMRHSHGSICMGLCSELT